MDSTVFVVRRKQAGSTQRFAGLPFYGVVAVAALLCIWLSLGPRPAPRAPTPQAGRAEAGGAFVFGPQALQHVAIRDARAYVPRTPAGEPTALRVAKALGIDAESGGARLALAPQTTRSLAGRPLQVAVRMAPLEVTTAEAIEVGLEGAQGTVWRRAALQADAARTLTLTFPALAEGPRAVWLRPAPQAGDYAYGLEIAAIRVRPLGK